MQSKITICYFGVYNPNTGRNAIYIKGLKENGVKIIECSDKSSGLLKFWRLWRKHGKIKNDYDFMIVGYPGQVITPFAKMVSSKKVILDALCSLYEGEILSRGVKKWSLEGLKIQIVDFLAYKFADAVLVETESQKRYFEKRFGRSQKYKVIYTGVNSDNFYKDDSIAKRKKFTAVFRGKFLPEAGVKYVIEAADLLKDKGIDFLIIGNGFLNKEIESQIQSLHLKNLEWISEDLSNEQLRKKMSECHVSLGQFENHERLERTIPHKCFETLAMGLPYITSRTPAVSEILEDGVSALFVSIADSKDLADKILEIKNDSDLAKKIAENGMALYNSKLAPSVLAKEILKKI